MRLISIFVAAILVTAGAAGADPLSDLKASVSKLNGTEPVKGTVRLDRTSSNDDEGDAKKEAAQVSFPFSVGPQGLNVSYPAALLHTAEAEEIAQSSNPETTTPVGNTLRSLDPVELGEALDAAPVLSRLLERSKFVSVNPTTQNGRPVKVLVLRVEPRMSKSEKKRIKKLDMTLKVMVGEDGVPLAAEMSTYVKASMFLISFEQKENSGWTFARRGDRLVAVRHQQERSGSGMGQKSASKTITTIALD